MQQVYGLGSIRACLFVPRSRNRRFQMFWSQRVEPYNGLPMLVFTYDVYIQYLCICVYVFHIYVMPVLACARVECSIILYVFFVCASIQMYWPPRPQICLTSSYVSSRYFSLPSLYVTSRSMSLCVASRSMSRAVAFLSTCRATEVAMCRRIARAIAQLPQQCCLSFVDRC